LFDFLNGGIKVNIVALTAGLNFFIEIRSEFPPINTARKTLLPLESLQQKSSLMSENSSRSNRRGGDFPTRRTLLVI
jgi:hypothetical protein